MKTNFIVRQTTEADYTTVYDLIKTAFLTAEHRDGDEQDFAVNLRSGEGYIPELDLVAEIDGQLMGHIMLTKTYVARPDGSQYDTLMVAPLSVLLEYRSTGVGSALMQEGLRLAMTMGYETAFLVGDPNYYQRFGYQPTQLFGISHESIPGEYVLVKEMKEKALNGVEGIIKL